MDEGVSKANTQFLEEINKINTSKGDSHVIEEELSDAQMHFSVTNPVKVGSVIKYTVVGQDAEGRFETQRRFNEFYTLRKCLVTRWPGCYVPCIPEKGNVGVDVS